MGPPTTAGNPLAGRQPSKVLCAFSITAWRVVCVLETAKRTGRRHRGVSRHQASKNRAIPGGGFGLRSRTVAERRLSLPPQKGGEQRQLSLGVPQLDITSRLPERHGRYGTQAGPRREPPDLLQGQAGEMPAHNSPSVLGRRVAVVASARSASRERGGQRPTSGVAQAQDDASTAHCMLQPSDGRRVAALWGFCPWSTETGHRLVTVGAASRSPPPYRRQAAGG